MLPRSCLKFLIWVSSVTISGTGYTQQVSQLAGVAFVASLTSRTLVTCSHCPSSRRSPREAVSRFLIQLHELFPMVQEASRRLVKRSNVLRQQLEASQLSACEGIFRKTLRCFWLCLIGWFGLPCDALVTSLSKRPTHHGTFCSTPFLLRLVALIT